MTDIHDELNRIAILQGRSLIDGTKIQDDTGQPWPTDPPEPVTEDPDYPEEPPPWYPPEPIAPTIDPVPWPPARPEPEPVQDRVGAFADFLSGLELMVHDSAAMYRARAVELNPEERSRIVRVVLGALRRTLEEQYAEVAGPPRKRRKNLGSGLAVAAGSSIGNDEVGLSGNQPAPGGNPGAHDPSSPAAKKRRGGRPKKVRQQLDGTERPQ